MKLSGDCDVLDFHYTAGYVDDPWELQVSVSNYGGTLFASFRKDGRYLMQIRKIYGAWTSYGRLPDGFTAEDLAAAGEEIDRRLELKKASES